MFYGIECFVKKVVSIKLLSVRNENVNINLDKSGIYWGQHHENEFSLFEHLQLRANSKADK